MKVEQDHRGGWRATYTQPDTTVNYYLGLYPDKDRAMRAVAVFHSSVEDLGAPAMALAEFAHYRSAFALDEPLANLDPNIDVWYWQIDRQSPSGEGALGSG